MSVLNRSVAAWQPRDDPFDWIAAAACTGVSTDIFFPEVGASYATAKAICARCPVSDECRAEVDRVEARLTVLDVTGMYAGETPAARLRRRRADGDAPRRRG